MRKKEQKVNNYRKLQLSKNGNKFSKHPYFVSDYFSDFVMSHEGQSRGFSQAESAASIDQYQPRGKSRGRLRPMTAK